MDKITKVRQSISYWEIRFNSMREQELFHILLDLISELDNKIQVLEHNTYKEERQLQEKHNKVIEDFWLKNFI